MPTLINNAYQRGSSNSLKIKYIKTPLNKMESSKKLFQIPMVQGERSTIFWLMNLMPLLISVFQYFSQYFMYLESKENKIMYKQSRASHYYLTIFLSLIFNPYPLRCCFFWNSNMSKTSANLIFGFAPRIASQMLLRILSLITSLFLANQLLSTFLMKNTNNKAAVPI